MSMLELLGNSIAFVALLSGVVLYLWRTPETAQQSVARARGGKSASVLIAASGRSKL